MAQNEPDPGRAEDGGGRGGDEGGDQHLALEPDVDDAGPLRPQARDAGEDQRHAHADRGGEELDIEVHWLPSPPRGKNSAESAGRKAYSKAPMNRMTRPWMTTTMSRLISGLAKESSEPPW